MTFVSIGGKSNINVDLIKRYDWHYDLSTHEILLTIFWTNTRRKPTQLFVGSMEFINFTKTIKKR